MCLATVPCAQSYIIIVAWEIERGAFKKAALQPNASQRIGHESEIGCGTRVLSHIRPGDFDRAACSVLLSWVQIGSLFWAAFFYYRYNLGFSISPEATVVTIDAESNHRIVVALSSHDLKSCTLREQAIFFRGPWTLWSFPCRLL